MTLNADVLAPKGPRTRITLHIVPATPRGAGPLQIDVSAATVPKVRDLADRLLTLAGREHGLVVAAIRGQVLAACDAIETEPAGERDITLAGFPVLNVSWHPDSCAAWEARRPDRPPAS